MDRVVRELQAAGATVVDVVIPDYDAEYAKARGSAPGSLKAGWEAYLARGATAGRSRADDRGADRVGQDGAGRPAPARRRAARRGRPAPRSTRRRASSTPAARRSASCSWPRWTRERLDALLYPANQARPHTHEGGAERYGTEPGTCEESAATGLPQVTVPAGFMGGRYPVGVSFLGRMWADRRLLGLAYAYEQATKHRRPPTTVK